MQDLNDKVTKDLLTAAEFNQPMSEIQNVIESQGITLSSGDLSQLSKSIAAYIANGDFYSDSGSANTYVLNVIGTKQFPSVYYDGMRVRFIAGSTNTGASTINVAGIGVKNLYRDGAVLEAGMIPSGDEIQATYSQSNDRFDVRYGGPPDRLLYLLSSTPSKATLEIQRAYSGTSADRVITLRLKNLGEDVGGGDYQNEVHFRLRAGSTTNHRRYIGWESYTGALEWLFGVNGSSHIIFYDDADNVHRLRMESDSTGSGDTEIAAAGNGVIKLGYTIDPGETVGDGGVEIWDGGPGASNLLRFDFVNGIFSAYNDSGTALFTVTASSGRVLSNNEIQAIQGFRSASYSIGDDSVASFDLPGTTPSANIIISSISTTGPQGSYWVRASATPGAQLLTNNANANVTTGVLTGTTGADTKFTVSAANDGKVYLENRLGATVTVSVTITGVI